MFQEMDKLVIEFFGERSMLVSDLKCIERHTLDDSQEEKGEEERD